MSTFTILCQLNEGCLGCCGHDFGTREELQQALKKNTDEFTQASPKTVEKLLQFRDRFPATELRFGLCCNLIEKEGRIICPLHPAQNQGKELRKNHCDINFLCPTALAFAEWDALKQERFLQFIQRKEIDNLDYSLGMDDGSLKKEFED